MWRVRRPTTAGDGRRTMGDGKARHPEPPVRSPVARRHPAVPGSLAKPQRIALFLPADNAPVRTPMPRMSFRLLPALAFATAPLFAQNSVTAVPADASLTTSSETAKPKEPVVEFEMMTWPEVKEALAAGKTT